MAVAMFLKVEGIDGESKNKDHVGEIDITSWTAGMTQSGTTHKGGGSGGGKVNFQDISFTKEVDKATAPLMQACATGKHIPEIVLVTRKSGGEALDYLKIEMKECIISSHQMGGAAGSDDMVSESVTINFGIINFTYKEQDDNGVAKSTVSAGFNVMTDEKI